MEKWQFFMIVTLLGLVMGPMSVVGRSEESLESTSSYDLPINDTYIVTTSSCSDSSVKSPVATTGPESAPTSFAPKTSTSLQPSLIVKKDVSLNHNGAIKNKIGDLEATNELKKKTAESKTSVLASIPPRPTPSASCRIGPSNFYSRNVPSLNVLNMVSPWSYGDLIVEENVEFRLIYDENLITDDANWGGSKAQLVGINTALPEHIQISLPPRMLDQLYLEFEAMVNASVDPELELANFTFQSNWALPLAVSSYYIGATAANLTGPEGLPLPSRNVTKGDGSFTSTQISITLQWQPSSSSSFGLTALFGMSSGQYSGGTLQTRPDDQPQQKVQARQARTMSIIIGSTVGGVVVAVAAIIIAVKAVTASSATKSTIRLSSV